MKRTVFTCVVFMYYLLSNAQITKIEAINPKQTEHNKIYDSLESVNNNNYMLHVGQTLYLKESNNAKKYGYSFYVKPFSNWSTREVYNPIQNGVAMYDYLKGRYFDVIGIIDIEGGEKKIFFLQLIEKESRDTVYSNALNDFLTVGYYEKLKSKYVGKKYVCQTDFVFFGVETLKRDKTIPKGTVLECIDLPFAKLESFSKSIDEVPEIVAVLESNEYGKCICSIRLAENTDIFSTWEFKRGRYRNANYSFNILPLKTYEDLERESAVKKELARKYGQGNANLIVQGKVSVGFTGQMYIEAWGEPEDINTTTGSYGKHEQWVYSVGYLYFENGKLVTIQN